MNSFIPTISNNLQFTRLAKRNDTRETKTEGDSIPPERESDCKKDSSVYNKEVNMTSENIPVNAGHNNIDEVSFRDKLVEPTSTKL